mmetsp:Transcript_35828/g.106934  ORF Transcript_35828/g.106934 Transcript_35828/m.106934 type:complete len:86 (-) Transcript_35828:1951-2208(-)
MRRKQSERERNYGSVGGGKRRMLRVFGGREKTHTHKIYITKYSRAKSPRDIGRLARTLTGRSIDRSIDHRSHTMEATHGNDGIER